MALKPLIINKGNNSGRGIIPYYSAFRLAFPAGCGLFSWASVTPQEQAASMLRQHVIPRLPDIAVAMAAAQQRARRLAQRHGLQHADEEDARQAILLDLVRRADRFDAARAPWPAFVTMVTRHAACEFGADLRRARSQPFVPLDEAPESVAATPDPDRLIDIGKALASLPHSQARLLVSLLESDGVAGAQKTSGIPAASFYRRLRQLRRDFDAVRP